MITLNILTLSKKERKVDRDIGTVPFKSFEKNARMNFSPSKNTYIENQFISLILNYKYIKVFLWRKSMSVNEARN